VVFGVKLYVLSQCILYSAPDLTLLGLESGALLVGGLFLVRGYARGGWPEPMSTPPGPSCARR